MKHKILKTTAAIAFGLGLSAAALGAPTPPTFSFTNTAGWDGTFEIKFTNYESFYSQDPTTGALTLLSGPAPGAINFGILRVTSINRQDTGEAVWSDGQNGAELTAVFSNIKVSTVTGTAPNINVQSTGGTIDVFLNPFGTFSTAGGFSQGMTGYSDASCTIGTLCYDGITNAPAATPGELFFEANWVPGVLDPNTTITVNGNFNATTTPETGQASGFLSVLSGAFASLFDTNGWTFSNNPPADLNAQNDFCTPGQTGCVTIAAAGGNPALGLVTNGVAANGQNGWLLKSNDPVRGAIRIVPEPATLGLVGLSLLALGFVRRKRS